MTETFFFKVNTTELRAPLTMQEAIDGCRSRVMNGGRDITLYVRLRQSDKWTELGTYSFAQPKVYTDRITGQKEKVPCCEVTLIPLKRFHF